MPAVSKKQQRFFGIVRSIQKGEQKPTTPETAKAASSMKMKSVKKFAKTKHKGLPEKKNIKEESCGKGEYYCYDDKKCKPIPEGMKVGKDGMLVQEAAFAIPAAGIASKVIPAAAATIGAVGTMMQARKKRKISDMERKLTDRLSKKSGGNQKVGKTFDTTDLDLNKKSKLITPKNGQVMQDSFVPEDVKTELLTKANERHKKAKSFKQFRRDSQKPLRRGEVRKYDPTSKSYKSNMSEVLEPISVPLKKIKTDLDNRKKVKDFQDRFRSPDRKLADEYEPELQEKSAAWQRKEGKNKSGGLNEKGRKSYERENPGSDLKAPQPEGGPRKRSFCARMGGVKGPMKKPDGSPTRKALALRKWKC